jgi:hypothetical protein
MQKDALLFKMLKSFYTGQCWPKRQGSGLDVVQKGGDGKGSDALNQVR